MSDPTKVDANDLLVKWKAEKKDMGAEAKRLLVLAKPLLTMVAEQTVRLPEDDRADGVQRVIGLLKTMKEEERSFWVGRVSKLMKVSKATISDGLRPKNGKKKKDEDEGEGEPIFTAGGWIQHHLVELYYKPEEMKTYLAVRYPDGHVSEELQERVYINGQKYLPISAAKNSNITKRTVRLPSELTEVKSEDELLDMTRKQINSYFDFGGNDFFEELSPLYVAYSYQADGFMEVLYLRAHGDYGTAKTRFLKSVGLLCYRPIYMSGGSSAASIYTLLDTYHGTLVLNEGDFTNSDEASMIAKILNGGTERGEAVTKMRGTMEKMSSESFDVFGCKVIATRKEFNDHAIKSRCITMDMIPMTPRPGIPFSLPPFKEEQDQKLRNLWMMRRLCFAKENITVNENEADRDHIEPRLIQITLSLYATINDQNIKDRIRDFLRKYSDIERGNRYEMFTARVLGGLVLAWAWGPVSEREEDTFRVYMKDIAAAINVIMSHQKEQLGEEEDDDNENSKDGKDVKKVRSRKVSEVFKNYLNLKTIRSTDGLPEYKGTKYVDMTEEQDRVKALCVRWGVEWLERGCLAEKATIDDEDLWMKKPKIVTINFNETPEGFKKARKEWYGQGNLPESEDE